MSGLEPYRRRLDEIDDRVSALLGERFAICREIAHYKRAHEIPMMQPERVAQVRERYLARGAQAQLPNDFSAGLFELLIAATCAMEDELMGVAEEVDAAPAGERQAAGAGERQAQPAGERQAAL
ncbi:MAG TPA: chorismate mutase [Solirubrobacteraceae bacterium]|nr:chorismate mutase [Solirubrobacteraceae bacterium]